MSHPRDETLTAYLDGELAPAQVAAVEEHLGECDRCRDELELAGMAAAALGSLPEEPVPLGVTEPVLREAGAARPAPRAAAARPPRAYRLLAAAAVLVLAVGGVWAGVRLLRDDGGVGSEPMAATADAGVPQEDVDRLESLAEEQAKALDDQARGEAAAPVPEPGDAQYTTGAGGNAESPGKFPLNASVPPKTQKCLDTVGVPEPGSDLVGVGRDTYAGRSAYFAVVSEGPEGGPQDRVSVWVFDAADCRILAFTTKYYPSMRPSPPTGFPSP